MPDFTQGTWTLDKRCGHMKANGKTIADVFGATVHNHSDTAAEAMANARLIAAAPLMYELLDMAAHSLRHHSDNDGFIAFRIVQLLARIDGKEVNNNA